MTVADRLDRRHGHLDVVIHPRQLGGREPISPSRSRRYVFGTEDQRFTVAIAKFLKGQGGHVFAFEPVAANFERLSQNVSLNYLNGNVSLFKFGLGENNCQATISMENDGGAATGNAVLSSALLADDPKGMQTTIEIRCLDEIADQLSIKRLDFIKVDIEGAEVSFLRGARKLIETHRPIIFGEFNECFIDRFGHSVLDANAQLSPLGYRAYRIGETIEAIDRLEAGMQEIAFVPPDRTIV